MTPTDTLTDAIQRLEQLLESRKTGLDQQPADGQSGDNLSAQQMRQQFANELVPLIESVPNRPPSTVDTWTHRGYMIGIDTFRDLYFTFRNCEAVQICFGLDNTLEEGGQLHLVFRGVGDTTESIDSLFTTGSWLGNNGGPVDPPKGVPCAKNQC
jgi:hypothetical protein